MRNRYYLMFLLIIAANTAFGQRSNIAKTPAIRYDWRPGLVNITEIGYGLGLSVTNVPYSNHFYSITNVTGYQFSRNAKIGVGYGIQPQNGGAMVPLFVDARVSPSSGVAVPFLGAAGGLDMRFGDFNSNSRIFFSASAGVRYVVKKKKCLSFSLGVLTEGGGSEGRSSFFNLKAGIEFKGGELSF